MYFVHLAVAGDSARSGSRGWLAEAVARAAGGCGEDAVGAVDYDEEPAGRVREGGVQRLGDSLHIVSFSRGPLRRKANRPDRRGKQVEYLQPPKDENMPLDVEMGDAMGPCRILVVRKRLARPDGCIRFATSIWSLSDDGAVRLQQKRMAVLNLARRFS